MADTQDSTTKYRHGEFLTMTDHILAGFKPEIEKNPDGSTSAPRDEYLQRKAQERKDAYDEEQQRLREQQRQSGNQG